ncbi:hypothetical protein EDD37DRAFT_378929 [Exophiala viscosa]|uniref:uncharacterized protein n=1 Tax=Exophiala viscosa TaxID=2486360 RepID=UPI0021A21512|nr:hypothetical protein EDD37DRAFT_378929 [Exophiala viscosa]
MAAPRPAPTNIRLSKSLGSAELQSEPSRSDMSSMQELINELLAAFQSQQHPWKSNLGAIESITAEMQRLKQAKPALRNGIHFYVSDYQSEKGEERYHDRIRMLQRQKDMKDLEKAIEDTLKSFKLYGAIQIANRVLRGRKRTIAEITEDNDKLDWQWETLDMARKQVKAGIDDYERGLTDDDTSVDGAAVIDAEDGEAMQQN